MKLLQALHINNTLYPVVEEAIQLDLSTPGRAQFVIDTNGQAIQPKQVVSFSLGYVQHDTMSRLFLGYVEKVTTIDKRCRVFCREFSAALNNPLPLALRHVTMVDVLTAISEKTGLNFNAGEGPYHAVKIANFYNMGSGYAALDSLAGVFNIPDYFWQQQGNGVVYAGSWQDSRWSSRSVTLDEALFYDHRSHSATVVAIQALRPGVKLNGKVIKHVAFAGNHMDIEWKSQ